MIQQHQVKNRHNTVLTVSDRSGALVVHVRMDDGVAFIALTPEQSRDLADWFAEFRAHHVEPEAVS